VEINTTQGTYDLNTGNAFFTNRSTVKDSSGRLYSANTMALENKTGNAQLEGNAVIIDSAGGYTIIANEVFLNKKNNSFLATRKPVLILKQKHDSTYIAADTIFSGFSTFVNNSNQVLKNDSTINVNISENEKVHETITNDSTQKYFEKIRQEELDSTNKILHEDPLKNSSNINHLIKSKKEIPHAVANDSLQKEKIISRSDTLRQILKEPEKDSSKKDSVQNEIDLKHPKIEVGSVNDSLQESLEKNRKPDSLPNDSLENSAKQKDVSIKPIKPGKDSTNKSDTSIRYFLAFHHVRIFNDSLQSICDSLFISSKDSVFRLYYNPVLWSGNTQIAGDTMFLYTENKQPKRLYVFESGMIVNQTKEGFFNQMSGKTINGYFVDGKIDYMRVKGTQAESVYYMQNDDSAYIGMNRASADVIDMFFKNEDLKKVLFVNNINGKMYPMNQIPEDQKKLKNFKWLDAKRPKNKAELFE
jgi:hypothetical protein